MPPLVPPLVLSRALSLALPVLLVLLHAAPSSAQESGIAIGSKAPTGILKDVNGVTVDLSKVIGTKPVVLEFWATWCSNCKELEPTMLAVHKTYGKDVAIYAVAVNLNQSLERVKRYVTQYKYPFPMLWDETGDLSGAYEVPATSYVVVIGKNGNVVYTGLGGKQDLAAAIRKAR